MHVYVCVFACVCARAYVMSCRPLRHSRHLEHALLWVEATVWLIFCTTSADHIAGWCIFVNMRKSILNVCVNIELWYNVRRRVYRKSGASIGLCYRRTARRPPGLTSLYDERIAINIILYAFTSHAQRGVLGFNLVIFGKETSNKPASPSLLVPARNLSFYWSSLPFWRSNPRHLRARQWL